MTIWRESASSRSSLSSHRAGLETHWEALGPEPNSLTVRSIKSSSSVPQVERTNGTKAALEEDRVAWDAATGLSSIDDSDSWDSRARSELGR